jgi:hypothetical protein
LIINIKIENSLLSMMSDRVTQLSNIQKEANDLFKKKNADYGDAFATYGTVGILVRMGDKIQRLQSITNKGINLVNDETLRDTLMDLHNYSAMGIMLLDETDNEHPPTTPVSRSSPSTPPHNWLQPISSTFDTWTHQGLTADYTRTKTVNGRYVTNTCTCPSFVYCTKAVKTCKHIDE